MGSSPRSDLHYRRISTPLGPIVIGASDNAIIAVEFDRGQQILNNDGAGDLIDLCSQQLNEYFDGKRRRFDLPLHLVGTAFQRGCWNELMKIPYGETRSYAELAKAVGNPRGFRAVGMANHDNPIAVIIPCHRVIASDGKLGGYGGGLPAKQWLLDLERRVAGQGTFRFRSDAVPEMESS
jgi:methylated-DNA-[protein]-cysteine S-methyltransferase